MYASLYFSVAFKVGCLAASAREHTSCMRDKLALLSFIPNPVFVQILILLTLSQMLHLLEWPASRTQAILNADEGGGVGTVIYLWWECLMV